MIMKILMILLIRLQGKSTQLKNLKWEIIQRARNQKKIKRNHY